MNCQQICNISLKKATEVSKYSKKLGGYLFWNTLYVFRLQWINAQQFLTLNVIKLHNDLVELHNDSPNKHFAP